MAAIVPAGASGLEGPSIDGVSYYGGLSPGGLAFIEGFNFDRTAAVRLGGLPTAVFDVVASYCDVPTCEKDLLIQDSRPVNSLSECNKTCFVRIRNGGIAHVSNAPPI